MVVNAVAPWEGQIIWVGTPNGGMTQSGQEWKSVEFALKYTDMRLQEKNIVFNAFGIDLVNKILSIPIGTAVRVTWSPDARRSNQQDGSVRWFGKLSAFGVQPIQPTQTQQPPQGFPQQGFQQPQYQQGTMQPQSPVYQQPAQQYAQPAPAAPAIVNHQEEDLPW